MGSGKGGNSQPAATSSTVSQVQIPQELIPYYQDVMNRAQEASTQTYTPYTGQRIADFTQPQQQGFQMATNAATAYQPSLDIAKTQAGIAGQTTPGVDMQQYMNPFLSNVLNPQLAEARRQFNISQGNRDAAAARSNAFGGGRAFVENSNAQEALGRQLDQIQGQGLYSAYNQGLAQFNQDRTNAGQNATLQNALAGSSQQLGLQGASALGNVGAQQQAQQQQLLSQSYQDFLNQRDWNKQQIGWQSDIVHGLSSTPHDTVQTQSIAPPSTLSQLASLGSAGMGISKLATMAKGGKVSISKFAEGGKVKKFATAGFVSGPSEIYEPSIFSKAYNIWKEGQDAQIKKRLNRRYDSAETAGLAAMSSQMPSAEDTPKYTVPTITAQDSSNNTDYGRDPTDTKGIAPTSVTFGGDRKVAPPTLRDITKNPSVKKGSSAKSLKDVEQASSESSASKDDLKKMLELEDAKSDFKLPERKSGLSNMEQADLWFRAASGFGAAPKDRARGFIPSLSDAASNVSQGLSEIQKNQEDKYKTDIQGAIAVNDAAEKARKFAIDKNALAISRANALGITPEAMAKIDETKSKAISNRASARLSNAYVDADVPGSIAGMNAAHAGAFAASAAQAGSTNFQNDLKFLMQHEGMTREQAADFLARTQHPGAFTTPEEKAKQLKLNTVNSIDAHTEKVVAEAIKAAESSGKPLSPQDIAKITRETNIKMLESRKRAGLLTSEQEYKDLYELYSSMPKGGDVQMVGGIKR